VCGPLTSHETLQFYALQLGAIPSLCHSSHSTLCLILTTFTLELFRYLYCDLALRLHFFPTAFLVHLWLRLWLRLCLHSLIFNLRLRLWLHLWLCSTSPYDFDCDCIPSLPTLSPTYIPQMRTLPYTPYLPTSSFYRRSTWIQHLTQLALASASYHSWILPLTARLGVCYVLVSSRQEQVHQRMLVILVEYKPWFVNKRFESINAKSSAESVFHFKHCLQCYKQKTAMFWCKNDVRFIREAREDIIGWWSKHEWTIVEG